MSDKTDLRFGVFVPFPHSDVSGQPSLFQKPSPAERHEHVRDTILRLLRETGGMTNHEMLNAIEASAPHIKKVRTQLRDEGLVHLSTETRRVPNTHSDAPVWKIGREGSSSPGRSSNTPSPFEVSPSLRCFAVYLATSQGELWDAEAEQRLPFDNPVCDTLIQELTERGVLRVVRKADGQVLRGIPPHFLHELDKCFDAWSLSLRGAPLHA